MKFKVGDKVKITDNVGGSVNKIGEIGVIVDIGDRGELQVQVSGNDKSGNWHWDGELLLVGNKDESSSLKETVSKLQARVKQLGKLVEDSLGVSKDEVFTYEDYKKLIQEAKGFANRNLGGLWVVNGEFVVIDFNINKDKQTVVALAKTLTFMGKSEVIKRGIAKCLPEDVFQEDIGKAIALGRLLGKDVSKFTNI